MRKHFGYDGSSSAYLDFLRYVRGTLMALESETETWGFPLTQLPARIGRPFPYLPKLLDEYHWVTISRGRAPPDEPKLSEWARVILR